MGVGGRGDDLVPQVRAQSGCNKTEDREEGTPLLGQPGRGQPYRTGRVRGTLQRLITIAYSQHNNLENKFG